MYNTDGWPALILIRTFQSRFAENQSPIERFPIAIETFPIAIESRLSRNKGFPIERVESIYCFQSSIECSQS